jgi:hypothetical protein
LYHHGPWWYLAANRTENTLLTDAGLQKLKPGEKLYRRGDRDGMYVAVLPINRRKQIWESGDHTIKVVH